MSRTVKHVFPGTEPLALDIEYLEQEAGRVYGLRQRSSHVRSNQSKLTHGSDLRDAVMDRPLVMACGEVATDYLFATAAPAWPGVELAFHVPNGVAVRADRGPDVRVVHEITGPYGAAWNPDATGIGHDFRR